MITEALDYIRSRKKGCLCMAAINILVFAVLSFLGNTEDAAFMLRHGACYTPFILEGEYWRLFTAMFLHFGLLHLIYNMICIMVMGDMLETETGTLRFLIIYLAGGLAGNLLSIAADLYLPGRIYPVSAGASGAAFAVIGAIVWIALRRKGKPGRISLQRVGLMTALMVLQGFTTSGTDNAAHVGGLAAGFILAVLLRTA